MSVAVAELVAGPVGPGEVVLVVERFEGQGHLDIVVEEEYSLVPEPRLEVEEVEQGVEPSAVH